MGKEKSLYGKLGFKQSEKLEFITIHKSRVIDLNQYAEQALLARLLENKTLNYEYRLTEAKVKLGTCAVMPVRVFLYTHLNLKELQVCMNKKKLQVCMNKGKYDLPF